MLLEKTIKILDDLVALPCLGGESNLSIAYYIEKLFQENKLSYHQVFDETGTKLALHCRIGEALDGGVILSGHTDVVPAEEPTWTSPPFKLVRKENKLYGRGASDMKSFLACCLAVLPEMQKMPLKRPIYLAFSYDEEVMCSGAPELIQAINDAYAEKPAFAIIGEPTEMKTIAKEKGMGSFTTTVYSTAGHSSLIPRHISAIEEATVLIQWLVAKRKTLAKVEKTESLFEIPHTTIHIGTINGGTAVNIIADRCDFKWDVRNIPEDSIEDIIAEFEQFCKERIEKQKSINPAFNIETSFNYPIVPALNATIDADFVKQMNRFNGSTQANAVPFASEAGQYEAAGYEAILCGPGNINRAHKANEYVETEELSACLDFLQKLIEWSREGV